MATKIGKKIKAFSVSTGEPQAAAPAADRADVSGTLESLCNLGEMVSRNIVTARDLIDRHLPVG